jgi:N-acetylglucosaminyldiphosphoundecaprenol N-acetyl-beta-D-mannosaminyltransferase
MYPMVMEHASRRKLSVFLLGGTPRVLDATTQTLRLTYPQVSVCGGHSGYFSDSEIPEIIEKIRHSAADLLLISRGSSLHADFISRCRNALHVGLIWNTGGLFDFVSGRVPRAPKWMRNVRIEWLFRLLIQPFQKAHRIFVVAPWFLTQVLRALWIRYSRPSGKESVRLEIEK